MDLYDVKSALDKNGFKTEENDESINKYGVLPVYNDDGSVVAYISLEEGEFSGTGFRNTFVVKDSNETEIKRIHTEDPEDVVELVESFA